MASWITKILRALLFGRWKPIEALAAVHILMVGVWILFPFWDVANVFLSLTNVSRSWEMAFGAFLVFNSIIHIGSVAFSTWSMNLRKRAALLNFISYIMLTQLAVVSEGIGGVRWLSYLTLAALVAMSYLALVIDGAS